MSFLSSRFKMPFFFPTYCGMHLAMSWHNWRQGSQDCLENKAYLRTFGGDRCVCGPKIPRITFWLCKVFYLFKSWFRVLAHRISLSAPKALLCMELLSFDVFSDIVFPKQLCCCTAIQKNWAALLSECMVAFVLMKASLGEGTASNKQARP